VCASALPGENGTHEIGVEMNKNVPTLSIRQICVENPGNHAKLNEIVIHPLERMTDMTFWYLQRDLNNTDRVHWQGTWGQSGVCPGSGYPPLKLSLSPV